MSSLTDANRAIVRRFFAAIESGYLSAFDEIVAEDYDDHLPGQARGRNVLRAYFTMPRMALPDLKLPIHDIVAEGDRVAVLNSVTGTHRCEFPALRLQPTGRVIDAMALKLQRIENGRMAEHWEGADFAALMRQLTGLKHAPFPEASIARV